MKGASARSNCSSASFGGLTAAPSRFGLLGRLTGGKERLGGQREDHHGDDGGAHEGGGVDVAQLADADADVGGGDDERERRGRQQCQSPRGARPELSAKQERRYPPG